jgi:CelD/BcsL family acetyltransferase involved in cellulose biosynthesis
VNLPIMATTCEVERSVELSQGFAEPAAPTIAWLDPLKDARWRDFVDRHPESSAFHRVEWLEALRLSYGFEPVLLTTAPWGEPLRNGLLLCKVRSRLTGNRLVSLPFSDHCEPLADSPDSMNDLLSSVANRVDQEQWKYFELRPIRYSTSSRPDFALSATYYFHRLDLRPDEQALFKGFHKASIQRKIAKAGREGLRCEQGSGEELLEHFYKLLLMTRRRHGLPPQPRKWFRSLIAAFGADLQIRVAFKAGTPVASILTLSHKKTLVYKYGCSDRRFNNLGGTVMLFWQAIQEARAKGILELDMGRSDLDNPGLVTFKERWGAERSSIHYWRYPAASSASRPRSLGGPAKWLLAKAPDLALTLLSNVAYRHIA